jgi:hypothetical protein
VVIMANQGAVCEATGEVFPQAIDVMTRLRRDAAPRRYLLVRGIVAM